MSLAGDPSIPLSGGIEPPWFWLHYEFGENRDKFPKAWWFQNKIIKLHMSGLLPNWTAMICAHYPPLHGADVAKSLSWYQCHFIKHSPRMMASERMASNGAREMKRQSCEGLFLLNTPQGPQSHRAWRNDGYQVTLLSQEADYLHDYLHFIVYEWKTY